MGGNSDNPEHGGRSAAPLFQPLDINDCHIDNRIVMSPMTRNFAPDGVISEVMIDYYRRRAEGGVGLIVTEGVAPTFLGAYAGSVPQFYGEPSLAMWKKVVDAVHGAGGKIMPQLWHSGLGRIAEATARPDERSVGPVGEYPRNLPMEEYPGFVGGRGMETADIEETIEAFATAAANAQSLGFDGVQLHGAHGYLIDEFFWRKTNLRDDRYGGADIASRTRFAVEMIQEIRRQVGPKFPIGLRFSQWKLVGHYDAQLVESPQELEKFLTPLVDAGLDMFDCSTRRYWEPAFEGSDLSLAGWTKKLSGKTTMTVGSIGLNGLFQTTMSTVGTEAKPDSNLDRLLEMFERGDFDLVGVGRALLPNPGWANAVREGRFEGLKPYSGAVLGEVY
jgi:2,4-dienoyl-CoA reductase-like NADH-dependent reductase (Old Yellow Enzyme family)